MPTTLVPKPPPPDWTIESEAEESGHAGAQRANAVLPGWESGWMRLPNPWEVDTSCRTRVAPRVGRGSVSPAKVAPLRVVPAGTASDVSVPIAPATTEGIARRSPARPRVALGCFLAFLSLSSLGLAFWQLYWLLEATETGRAILDHISGAVAQVTGSF